MKKLFTILSRANNNSVGISFNHRRVSFIYSMLTLIAIMLMVPSSMRGAIVTDAYYDFKGSIDNGDTQVTLSGNFDETYTGCQYFSKIGNVNNPGRLACGDDRGVWEGKWILTESHKLGLYAFTGGTRQFLVSQLSKGSIVTFDVVDTSNNPQTISLVSNNATAEGNKFTMTQGGVLVVGIPRYLSIKTITIQHDDAGAYSYDPAVEIYDLYNATGSYNTSNADFNLNGSTAKYITTLQNGMSLNNRIAIDGGNWVFNDHGLKAQGGWHNLSVCNLREGDRVVIQYTGQATFSSVGQNGGYNGCPAFKDIDNDGEFNDQDVNISNGMTLDAKYTGYDGNVGTNSYITYAYTVTEDGHLDIGLAAGSRIFKITIYGDHQAQMLDRYNGSATAGYTAYFSSTGQLMAKEHMVPGGLEVQVGNTANEDQHAEVVMSDKGPVSFVYDEQHYKMAKYGGVDVMTALPTTGTYYKFIPEVSGRMWLKFKAVSVRYRSYNNGIDGNQAVDQYGTPNEYTDNVSCPYYLMVAPGDNNAAFSRVENAHYYTNGEDGYFGSSDGNPGPNNGITVESGKTYYLYGWWKDGTSQNALTESAAGVAELLEVTFIPDKMVTPLAKWVANTNWINSSDYVEVLADVTGFTANDIHIKKLSDNITGCTPYIENDQLKITGVTFKKGTNPGGTILIKLGNPSSDADPVFAYTIAYDASYESDGWTDNNRSEGHTWDFSTNPLKGLKWTNTSGQASVVDFSTENDEDGLLYQEMHETNPDGTPHSDWTKTWRVINSAGEGTHDLMFLNKYDMEGDNADMMWDTEGIIINTSSNQSCINNEFGGVVDHSKKGTPTDPDRYVGILPGGSFTIPALKAGDRVCIFMGSGDGSGNNACKFNITGALDAIGQTISSSDIYNAGGSPWEYNKGNESRYRGAYQFISTGGDMTFTMNGGSMTKLYSITIYRGAKSATVDCTRSQSQTYNGEVYDGYTYSFNNDWRTTTPAKTAIALHYRGKGERLRTPTVVYKSGNVSTGSDNLFYAEVGDKSAPFIFYKSKIQDYGMFRMRIEDLELGNKYVADYALQNISVGYLEKKNYPYTWDFTDLMDYVETNARILGERTNVSGYDPRTVDTNKTYEIEFMNNTVGEGVKAVEQWKQYAADGDIPAGYGLHINNEPYSGGCMWAGGQLYANEQAFDESFGLSILPPLNSDGESSISKDYNGGVRICNEGLCLTGGIWRIMIPLVGGEKVASVYIRAKQVGSRDITAGVGDAETAFTYVGTATDGTGDKIYAVKGTGDDMTLFFNNLIIKKIAISQDPKTVNKLGYATESRNVVIDPELMGYMTGTGLKAYTVTNVTYGENAGDIPSITLTEIPSNKLMGKATSGDKRGYIIYNTDDTKAVNILDNGFHLFVPDMHDDSDATDPKKTILDVSGNYLKSHILSGSIPQFDGDYTNYLMNYKYSDQYGTHEGPEAFYRASSNATLGNNKAYLQLLTAKVKPADASFSKSFAIIFEDEFNGINPGITTVIDNASSNEIVNENNAEWYNINGQKLNGKPTASGLYIVNGKKVVVK